MALEFKDSALLRSAQSVRLACPEPAEGKYAESETIASAPHQASACHSEARGVGRGICFAPAHNRFLASLGMTIRGELVARSHSQNQPRSHQAAASYSSTAPPAEGSPFRGDSLSPEETRFCSSFAGRR